MKRDLSSEVTVFVIAIEKGKNYNACLEALNNQTVDFKLEKILDISPMSKAFNQMLTKCETPYFIQCDEDMILKPNAVEYMHTIMLKNKPTTATLLFALHDVYEDGKIRGIRINRTEVLKKYPFQDTLACENNQKLAMAKDGYVTGIDGMIMGDHSPYWTNCGIFQRYYNMMERSKRWPGQYNNVPKELWKILKETPTKLNLYALLGAFSSLFTKENPNKEKNYITDNKNPKYRIINEKLFEIDEMKFISPEIRHSYILELSKHLNIELESDLNKVRASNKALILWNPYSYLRFPRLKWKHELMHQFKNDGKLAYCLERGALPGNICLDLNGFLYDSTSYDKKNWKKKLNKEEKNKVNKYIDSFINSDSSLENQQSGFVTKEKFYDELELNDDVKVFVALQVHNDSTVLLWSDWVESMANFQNIIETLADKMKNVTFLVKNNPVETKLMATHDNIKIVDAYHYKDCIKFSDMILTINSSIGLQAMMWEKPVITVGGCFYSFKDINQKARSIEDIEKYILNPMKPKMASVRKFINYLLNKLYISCIMKITSRGSSSLDKVKHVRFQTPDAWVNCPVKNTRNKPKIINVKVEKATDPVERIFKEFVSIVPDCCLLGQTCLEAVRDKTLLSNTTTIFISAPKINFGGLVEKGFAYDREKNEYKKDKLIFKILNWSKDTKKRQLYGCEVLVPFPVIQYLENLYGKDWRNRE